MATIPNRWVIAAAGVVMQVALGAVYAWSVFRIPLTQSFGWTIPQVTLAFTIAIFVLGFAAFGGGLWMRRTGPRQVAMAAGTVYGLGVFLASFAGGRLWWLYCSYGLMAGTGLGLGYIVPVATLVKWFPDKRGMITGIAVAGFGAGALITAPVATRLIAQVGALQTFAILGGVYFIAVTGAGWFMQNPPAGYRPPNWTPSGAHKTQRAERAFTLGEAVTSWQWYGLWTLLFLNTTAGIAIISQAAPMAQEITGVTAAQAAGLVGIISIANGAGRFLWAWLSDLIGRRFGVSPDVSDSGRGVSGAAVGSEFFRVHGSRLRRAPLLRRRLRHHAGVCRGLFRRRTRGLDLRPHVDGVGIRGCRRSDRDCRAPPEHGRI